MSFPGLQAPQSLFDRARQLVCLDLTKNDESTGVAAGHDAPIGIAGGQEVNGCMFDAVIAADDWLMALVSAPWFWLPLLVACCCRRRGR